VVSGEPGVSQAFLASWYIGGGYMDVSEVILFYDCGKIYVQNRILSLSALESVSFCEVMLQVAGMTMDGFV